jgi:hypothetical protein
MPSLADADRRRRLVDVVVEVVGRFGGWSIATVSRGGATAGAKSGFAGVALPPQPASAHAMISGFIA